VIRNCWLSCIYAHLELRKPQFWSLQSPGFLGWKIFIMPRFCALVYVLILVWCHMYIHEIQIVLYQGYGKVVKN